MNKRTPYVPPIAWDRLQAMIGELGSGKALSAQTRMEIGVALNLLYAKLCIESEQHTRGGRQSTAMRAVALQMHWLIEQKHAGIQDAALAVLPNGTAELVKPALKMYQTMNKAHEFGAIMHKLDPAYMETVAKLLPKPRARNK